MATSTKSKKSSKPRPSVGRPTAEQQAQRHEELLETALDTFLEHGYETATVDQIAIHLGMSKRTVYGLYGDKAALFEAAVLRAIERDVVSIEKFEALVTDNLQATLSAIAHLKIAHNLTKNGLKLQRILYAQAHHFPGLGDAAFIKGTEQVVQLLSRIFRRHAARGEINVTRPELTAAVFLGTAVGGPARKALRGKALTDSEIEDHVKFAINIFLNGIVAR